MTTKVKLPRRKRELWVCNCTDETAAQMRTAYCRWRESPTRKNLKAWRVAEDRHADFAFSSLLR